MPARYNQRMIHNDLTARPAQASDAPAIRALIHRVGINPTALDWRRFRVITGPAGQLLACGQIKPHGDGTRELASIAVQPEWQGRGLGKAMIAALLRENPPPLYLTCRSGLKGYYARFGFAEVADADLPPYFRRIRRLFALYRRLFKPAEDLAVMKLDESPILL